MREIERAKEEESFRGQDIILILLRVFIYSPLLLIGSYARHDYNFFVSIARESPKTAGCDRVIEDYLRLLQAEAESSAPPLSDREQDVLKLLVKGLNAKQIAARLDISKNTVDTHRRRIMDKVGCNSMAELTRYAIREGYLDLS